MIVHTAAPDWRKPAGSDQRPTIAMGYKRGMPVAALAQEDRFLFEGDPIDA